MEIVSHNSHRVIVNEVLILAIRVFTVSFMVATFVSFEKVFIK